MIDMEKLEMKATRHKMGPTWAVGRKLAWDYELSRAHRIDYKWKRAKRKTLSRKRTDK